MKISKVIYIGLASQIFSSSVFALELYKDEDTSLNFDGRVELRYNTYQDDSHLWDTGSTRWALKAKQKINDRLDVFAEGEWGFYTTEDSYDDNPKPTQRLMYGGFEDDTLGKVAAGKLWSVFYDVGWWTDMSRKYGSRAFGVYNFSDWGQVSGTGRADEAVNWRKEFGDWKVGLQYQSTRNDEDLGHGIRGDLKDGLGGSVRYDLGNDLEAGFAYYQNTYENFSAGADVDDGDKGRLFLTGLKYRTPIWHAAVNVGYGQQWEIAENGSFYDSIGAQAYVHRQFSNGFRPTFNFNWLDDTGNDSNGYKRLTYIYGLEYHFVQDRFLVWAEYQDNHGNKWNGNSHERCEDEWTLGIRHHF